MQNQEPWVLVPGTLCTPDVFGPLLNYMGVAKEHAQFITPDAPNVGDYQTTLRNLVTGGEIVCGFSLGAMILTHNLDALKKARAVVLLAANPFPDPPGNRANREAVRDLVLAGGARDWITQNWAAMSTDRGTDLRDFVASMAEATTHLIPSQTELAASRPGAERELLATDLPLVFVTGSDDRLTPPKPVRRIATQARHAVLNELDGLGHFALIESPDRVADAVLQGLETALPITTGKPVL